MFGRAETASARELALDALHQPAHQGDCAIIGDNFLRAGSILQLAAERLPLTALDVSFRAARL
jgi:hypothetical protein